MKKWILSIIFISIYLLITFFGLGPVLLADGSTNERIITLLVVIILYIITTLLFRELIKRQNINR